MRRLLLCAGKSEGLEILNTTLCYCTYFYSGFINESASPLGGCDTNVNLVRDVLKFFLGEFR